MSLGKRWPWIALAVTSGLTQTILMLLGGKYLIDNYEYTWLKHAIAFLFLWSLVWPVYVYLGMNSTYREMLKENRLGRSDQEKMQK